MNTARTVVYSTSLVVVGMGGYLLSNRISLTALFPTLFGILLTGCSYFVLRHGSRSFIYVGLVLAILGTIAPYRGLLGFLSRIAAGTFEFPLVVVSQTLMSVFCFLFVVEFIFELRREKA
jgi:hypothetical protein